MTTKAERIRQLLDAGMCNTMIAELIPCREEYVRTVKQRLSPERRAKDNAYWRALYHSTDKSLRDRAGRIAYREARKAGATAREASIRLCSVVGRVVAAGGDHAVARAAYHAAKRGITA